MRKDGWWVAPLLDIYRASGRLSFIRRGRRFRASITALGNYLSPFYSPELFGNSPHAMFGPKPAWIPAWLPFSPALLILWAPGGFRFTCYYYRGAYYKAFWADPLACCRRRTASQLPRRAKFPLILQNVHRYFLYLALIFMFILAYDAWNAMWFADDGWSIRHRRRHARADGERHSARPLHIRLSQPAASGRRRLRHAVEQTRPARQPTNASAN